MVYAGKKAGIIVESEAVEGDFESSVDVWHHYLSCFYFFHYFLILILIHVI